MNVKFIMHILDFGLGYSNLRAYSKIYDSLIEVLKNAKQDNYEQRDDVKLSNIYTQISGLDELKDEVIKKFKRQHKKEYKREEVIVSSGARGVIFNYLLALKKKYSDLNKKVVVKLITPYWGQYSSLLDSIDIQFNVFKSLQDIVIDSEDINVLCLINPGNPDGKLYSYEELNFILQLMNINKNLYVISDEVYSDIIFDGKEYLSLASLCNTDMSKRLIAINSCSKANELSGWRIGFGVTDSSMVDQMVYIQRSNNANVGNLLQYAALFALRYEADYLYKNILNYQEKRDFIIRELSNDFGVSNVEAGLFVLVKLNSDINPTKFCKFLQDNFNIIVFPGDLFNYPGVFRMCFARSFDDLREGVDRLKQGLVAYHKKFL